MLFFNTTHLHACVARLDNYGNTRWVEGLLYAIANLYGKTLLYLKAASETLYNTRDLREACDVAIRDICKP